MKKSLFGVSKKNQKLKRTKTRGSKLKAKPWWQRRSVIFVLFFALVATSLIIISRANSGFGDVPTADDELVVQYVIGKPHKIREHDFNSSMPPGMMLYANGLMLCGDVGPGHHTDDTAPATFRSRKLSAQETGDIFNKIKSLGIEKAANFERSEDFSEPAALANVITLNSTTGALVAAKYPGEKNSAYDAVERYLEAECRKTTKEYEPDNVVVETVEVPADQAPADAGDLTEAVDEIDSVLGGTLGVVEDKVKRVEVAAGQAEKLRNQIPRGTSKAYKLKGKTAKVRILPVVPEYISPQILDKNGKDKVSAQTASTARWLFILPAGVGANGSEQGYMNELALKIAEFYNRHTGKTMTVSQIAVYQGSKTAAQYQVCPDSSCTYTNPNGTQQFSPSLAVFKNMQAEFNKTATSTNVVYPFATSDDCMGWGGPVGPLSSHGFSAFSSGGCNWYDGSHIVGAHETGHTFGLPHTPCNGTLMDSGCAGQTTGTFANARLDATQATSLRDRSPFFNAPVAAPFACSNVPNMKPRILFNHIAAPATPGREFVQRTTAPDGSRRDYYYQYNGTGSFYNHNINSVSPANNSYTHSDSGTSPNITHGIILDYAPYFKASPGQTYEPTVNYHFIYKWTGVLYVQNHTTAGTPTTYVQSNGDGSGPVTDALTKTKLVGTNATTVKGPRLGPCGTASGGDGTPTPPPDTPPPPPPPTPVLTCSLRNAGTTSAGTVLAWNLYANSTEFTYDTGKTTYGLGATDLTPYPGAVTGGGLQQRTVATPTANTVFTFKYTHKYGQSTCQTTVAGAQNVPPVQYSRFRTTFYDYLSGLTRYGGAGTTSDPAVMTLNSNWGYGKPHPEIAADYFHVIWDGDFEGIPGTGTYTFYSEQDDGFALKINTTTVIDKWKAPAPTGQGTIYLTKGQRIRVSATMFETTGTARAKLMWSGPGIYGTQIFPYVGSAPTPPPPPPPTCNWLSKLLGQC